MDNAYVITILRFLHIMFAVAWFGLGLASAYFIGPAVAKAGASGLRFMKAMFTATPYARVFPIVSVGTVLAGILLYATRPSARFSTLGFAVLSIGAILGLLAAGHGGAVTGKKTRELGQVLVSEVPDGDGPIPAEAMAKIGPLAGEVGKHGRISFYIIAASLVFMALARYL
jgi:hypothetical protein